MPEPAAGTLTAMAGSILTVRGCGVEEPAVGRTSGCRQSRWWPLTSGSQRALRGLSDRAHSQQGPAPPRAPPFKTSQLECFRFVETVIFRKM